MGEVRLVGTAHVSQKSIDEVNQAIEEFKPDIIAVELDPGRYNALKKQQQEPASVDQVIESGNFTQMLIQWILAYLQRKIGMDVGVEPGAEMKAAVAMAEERQIPLALIDRDIRITLQRFWRSMSVIEKLKMIYALGRSVIMIDGGQEIDIDSLTHEDVVSDALDEFRKFSPRGARALIDERDAYMGHQLVRLAGQAGPEGRILAVVGAGHVTGINRYLSTPGDLPPEAPLTAPIKPFPWMRLFEVVVVGFFAFMIITIAFSGVGLDVLLWALLYWVLIHGVFTAVFTLAAGGHPLSALTGFAVSWYTALNPLIAAGWFSAIVEAKIRKPSPADFKRIFAAESLSEMWHIPLFKVVIVAALANVGSTIGTFVYFFFIFPMLGVDPAVVISQGLSNLWHAITSLLPS